MDTAADARKMGAALRSADEYAVIIIPKDESGEPGTVVKVFTAKSISRKAVPRKEDFQKIKTAVLDLLAPMANTTTAELEKETGSVLWAG